jgi:hypothetical protein
MGRGGGTAEATAGAAAEPSLRSGGARCTAGAAGPASSPPRGRTAAALILVSNRHCCSLPAAAGAEAGGGGKGGRNSGAGGGDGSAGTTTVNPGGILPFCQPARNAFCADRDFLGVLLINTDQLLFADQTVPRSSLRADGTVSDLAACLPACLPARPPACLPACLPGSCLGAAAQPQARMASRRQPGLPMTLPRGGCMLRHSIRPPQASLQNNNVLDGFAKTLTSTQGASANLGAVGNVRKRQAEVDATTRTAANAVTLDGSRLDKLAPDRVTLVQGQRANTALLELVKWVPRLIVTGTGPGFPLANEG